MARPEDFHKFPEPKSEISGRNTAEQPSHQLSRIAKLWRPIGASLDEILAATCARYARRLVKSDGSVMDADDFGGVENASLVFSDVLGSHPDGDLNGVKSNTGQPWEVYAPEDVKFLNVAGAATLDKWHSRDVNSPRNYPAIDMETSPRRMGALVSFHESQSNGVQPATMVLLASKAKNDFNGALHCSLTQGTAKIEFVDPDQPGLIFIGLTETSFGGRDTRTIAAAGTVSSSGNLSVKITSRFLPNGDITLPVAVVNGDAPATWMGKVNTALGVFCTNKLVHQIFEFSLAGTTLTARPWVSRGPDPTFNVSITNGTAAGITEVTTATVTTVATPSFTYGKRMFIEVEHVGDTITMKCGDPANPTVLTGTHEKLNRAGGRYAIYEWFGHGAVTGETPRMTNVGQLHAAWAGTDTPPDINTTLSLIYKRAFGKAVDPSVITGTQPFAEQLLSAETREQALAVLGLEKAFLGDKPNNVLEFPGRLLISNSQNTWSADGLAFTTNSGPNPIPTSIFRSVAGKIQLFDVDAASGGIIGTAPKINLDATAAWGAVPVSSNSGLIMKTPQAGPGLRYVPGAGELRFEAIPSVITALTDAATVAINAATTSDFSLLLTSAIGGTRVIGNPTNPVAGQKIWIRFKQPASGGPCGWSFGSAWNVGPLTITPSTVAGKEDYLHAVYNGGTAKWDILSFVPGY